MALRELVLVFHTGHEDLRGGTLPVRKRLAARFPESSDQVADLESSLVQRFDKLPVGRQVMAVPLGRDGSAQRQISTGFSLFGPGQGGLK